MSAAGIGDPARREPALTSTMKEAPILMTRRRSVSTCFGFVIGHPSFVVSKRKQVVSVQFLILVWINGIGAGHCHTERTQRV